MQKQLIVTFEVLRILRALFVLQRGEGEHPGRINQFPRSNKFRSHEILNRDFFDWSETARNREKYGCQNCQTKDQDAFHRLQTR